jgi:DNA-binding NarL/FixJ family response regulator
MAKLFIVDDHPIFLSGLAQFISENGHEVVNSASSVAECQRTLNLQSVDVLILDVTMNDGSGVDLLMELRANDNNIPIILLTAAIDPASAVLAIKHRVNAIVLKDSAPEEIVRVINQVMEGDTVIDVYVAEQMERYSSGRQVEEEFVDQRLTQRENQIVQLVRNGLRNQEIAARCNLTEGTVKVHLHNIFRKLNVKSRYELVVRRAPSSGQAFPSVWSA